MTEDMPDGAVAWHGYFDSASMIMALYATGHHSYATIADQMNRDGWAYRGRDGHPRPFTRDDIRRIVASAYTYGGIVQNMDTSGKHSKDWDPYHQLDIEDIPFAPERAVMPISLLKKVVQVRRERAMPTLEHGARRDAYKYAFRGKIRCYLCEELVRREGNPRLRTTLTGHHHNGQGCYRYAHHASKYCGTMRRSIQSAIFERDAVGLLRLMAVSSEVMDMMRKICIEAHAQEQSQSQPADFEKSREREIALWKKHVADMRKCLMDPKDPMGYEEFEQVRSHAEHEIARLEGLTSKPDEVILQLEECVNLINDLAGLWEMAEPEERQQLADRIFEYFEYNLDQQRIMDFRLRPAMDTFVVVRHIAECEENRKEVGDSPISSSASPMLCPQGDVSRTFVSGFQPFLRV